MAIKTSSEKPIGIFSYTGAENYGSVLQNWALSKQLNNFGLSCEQIFLYGHRNKKSPFYGFRKKYFNLTEPVFTYTQCLQLNDRYDVVITGSDAVWEERNLAPEEGMLAWASGKKNLVSYAASFGEGCYHGDTKDELVAAMLGRFDSISVREESGVEICASLGIEAEQVLDPTFLLSPEDYEMLIDTSTNKLDLPDDYILYYDAYSSLPEEAAKLKEKFASSGYNLITTGCYEKTIYTPEQWLDLIKNARYVITHSFHGLCFSLIFKKQFLHLSQPLANTRYASLFKQIGIEKKSHTLDDVCPDLIEHEPVINYTDVESHIKPLKEKSIKFLQKALQKTPTFKLPFIDSRLHEAGILKKIGEKEINNGKLEQWVNTHPHDPTLRTQHRDLLKLTLDLKMEELFYCYDTDDREILAERKLCRTLLLAQAKRIFTNEEYNRLLNDNKYYLNLHALESHINYSIFDNHRNYFKQRIAEFENKEVFILFGPINSVKIFSFAREYLKKLNIKAYLHFAQPSPALLKLLEQGIPLLPIFPFILSAPAIPVLSFGSFSHYMVALLKNMGCKNEVIPCAFG